MAAAMLPLVCILTVSATRTLEAAPAGGVAFHAAASKGGSEGLEKRRGRSGAQPGGGVAVTFSQARIRKSGGADPASKRPAGKRRTRRASKVSPGQQAEYRALVTRFAREYGVPADLAHAIVVIESNYHPQAVGSAGEIGLMQIKPSTARGMGYRGTVKGLFNPETNIRFGMKYLAKAHQLGKTTCGTVLKYNAGHGARRMNPVSSRYCARVKRILGR